MLDKPLRKTPLYSFFFATFVNLLRIRKVLFINIWAPDCMKAKMYVIFGLLGELKFWKI